VSAAKAEAGPAPVFSPKVIVGLILVGVFAFSAFAVLFAYAPDLRSGSDGGAHALSKSAVGFAGAVVLFQAEGMPTIVSRSPARKAPAAALLILTPPPATDPKDLGATDGAPRTLIVLPKWATVPDPVHPGWVRKEGLFGAETPITGMLVSIAGQSRLEHRAGSSKPRLRGGQGVFARETALPLGRIDSLQTISGKDWLPVLVDETGRMVLAQSRPRPAVYVLSDPDILNTQGLRSRNNARAASVIIETLKGEGGVVFDVSLNGFARGRSLLRTMLEPPLLGATLCAFAAAILTGLHALARFGPAARRGRAIALGKAALVDNSAGLVRMTRKEPSLLPAYAELTQALAARSVGGHAGLEVESRTSWLARLARLRRTALDLEQLVVEAGRARSRADTLGTARRLHHWRLEVTRERE
jgi:hypothetical protein